MVFEVGERVEYWSDTYSQWMQTTVQKIREDSMYYDLEVKKGAHIKKMRPMSRAYPDPLVPAPPPAQSDQIPRVPQAAPVKILADLQMPLGDSAANHAQSYVPTVYSYAPSIGQHAAQAPSHAVYVSGGSWVDAAPAIPREIASHGCSAEASAASGSASGRGSEREDGMQEGSHQISYLQSGTSTSALIGRSASVTPMVRRSNGDLIAPQSFLNGVSQIRSVSPITPAAANRITTPFLSGPVVGSVLQPTGGDIGQAVGGTSNAVYRRVVTAGSSSGTSGYITGHVATSAGPANCAVASCVGNANVANAGADMWQESGVWEIHQSNSARGAARGASFTPSRGAVEHPLPQQHGMPQQFSTPCPAPVVASRTGVAPHELGQPLETEDLQIGSGPFDPCDPQVLQQLQLKLGFPSCAGVEELKGFRGGLNEGVWFIGKGACAQHEEIVLKLVKCVSIAPTLPTEAESFRRVFKDHPGIVSDPTVAFPRKIFRCLGASGESRYDLICMRKMRGMRLAEVTAHKWHNNQKAELIQIIKLLGTCMAEFHRRYAGLHHGDLQPSNVFWDEEAGKVSLIDVGGMDRAVIVETDQAHFFKSLHLLSQHYGPQFATDGIRAFEAGYASAKF